MATKTTAAGGSFLQGLQDLGFKAADTGLQLVASKNIKNPPPVSAPQPTFVPIQIGSASPAAPAPSMFSNPTTLMLIAGGFLVVLLMLRK